MKHFFALVRTQFNKQVKVVHTDNGTEFTCLKSYFLEYGILHQTHIVYTPQQNGRIERKHRHILNVTWALLFQVSLPIQLWGESVLTFGYLINRTPLSVLKGETPFEMLFNKSQF